MNESSHQPDRFPDAERIVDAFGGVRPMAARLGVAATTIQGWKSRGNIPDARRQEVRDAARAAGINLAGIVTPDAAEAVAPSGDDTAPDDAAMPTPAARPGGGIAWLALAVATVAAVAVVTQPLWAPRQSGDTSGLAARIAALEAAPKPTPAPAPKLGPLTARIDALEAAPKPTPAPKLGPLTARVDALEAAIGSLSEAAARPEPVMPDPTPRIDALAARLDRDRERLDSVVARLETLSATAQSADQSRSADRAAALASIRAELAALRTRFDDAASGDGTVDAPAAALVLAVAALEDAVASGAPFETPLSVIERLAENDVALAQFVAVLAPHAANGVPTQARLAAEFDAIAARLSAPLWPQTGVGWIDGMLEKVDSLVTIRRLEDSAGKASPVVRAGRALAGNDLPRAVAALADVGGPGAAWVSRAKTRIAADRALAGLRLRAVEVLGQPAARAQ